MSSLPCPGEYCEPTDWSRDGASLLVTVINSGNQDVWIVPVDPAGPAKPLLTAEFSESDARFSLDGRWVAYVSRESDRPEVWVRTVSGPPRRVVVSGEGGTQPVWARDGKLPPVVFIEPRIPGIPPLEQASDDHPPANLLRGQEFLAGIYQALTNPNGTDPPEPCPQWGKCMLVITYDEHGGFYDHVPPPDGFEKIHPEGQTFLGVRVPTFVVSPLVSPGSVSHVVFDHTSIVKTILTRHRASFRTQDFARFGPRVLKISHLGEALIPPTVVPVIEDPERIPRTAANFGDVVPPPVTLSSLSPEVLAGTDDTPYGFTLARAMMPERRG